MQTERVIFHIDVNSAFLSWIAVKRLLQGDKVDLRTIPSVVSGDPSDRRSIITAKSIPAKKFMINTAEPVSMALRKCPSLVVVQGDWAWYKKCSEAFIAICRTYSPVLQQFSIDECFIDMTGRTGSEDPVKIADRLREDIRTRLGFTVNVGIGSNKLLAKMASDFQKPDRTHTLWLSEIEQKMWPLDVNDLLWVGKKSAQRLKDYGISTIGQLARTPVNTLVSIFGEKSAAQMHASSNGIDSSEVEIESSEAKSYSAERTFSRDIIDPDSLDRELFKVACTVAHRIRRDSFFASGVSVFVKTSDFVSHSKQSSLPQPTDVTAVILNEARKLIPQIWDGSSAVRQVGLGVSRLTHDTALQLSLFEDEKMGFYRQWDKEYDRKMEEYAKSDRHYRDHLSKALLFSYADGEKALRAAKAAVKDGHGFTFSRQTMEDGTDCFEVRDKDSNVIEVHMVVPALSLSE